MLELLRNADVYAPQKLGERDILIGGGKILCVGPSLPALPSALGALLERLRQLDWGPGRPL